MELTSEQRYEAAKAKRRDERQKLLERLESEHEFELATRLRKCGQRLRLQCGECGTTREAETRCDIKWCPSCAPALSTRTLERYRGLCDSARWPLFVTLTIKNYESDDANFLRPLRRAFGKLRRLRWWKRAVVGGVASIEITNTGKGWHPHIHALLDCRWLAVTVPEPQHVTADARAARFRAAAKEVSEQWNLCTGRKAGLKVRRIWKRDGGDPTEAAREVLKYSVKGSDLVGCAERIGPVLRMMEGTRLVTSWGSFFGHPANKRKRKEPCACGSCGETGTFVPEAVLAAFTKTRDDTTRLRRSHGLRSLVHMKQPDRRQA